MRSQPAEELIEAAHRAAANAYAPYSNFRVGAAASAGGKIFAGCNVENASFGLTICAERVALFSAIAAGERKIEAVAIFTDTDEVTPPCGACRQALAEFGSEMEVHLACRGGKRATFNLADLLPHAFDFDKRQTR